MIEHIFDGTLHHTKNEDTIIITFSIQHPNFSKQFVQKTKKSNGLKIFILDRVCLLCRSRKKSREMLQFTASFM